MAAADVAHASTTTEPSRPHTGLVHEPALDGLRGAAVAGVVVFHLERLQGGFLGVDLFFVLSGFLITSLLLTEARKSAGDGTGRAGIDLRHFWSRRARRLLPALWLVLVGVSVLLLVYTPEEERSRFRGDALGTLGYVANWERLSSKATYWDMFSQPSPLEHMWSLAIEEQFYVLWPLVIVGLIAVARRRQVPLLSAVRWVALGGAVVSLLWMALSFRPTNTNWAYFSTPTRLGPTLLGAALATVAVGRARRTKAPPTEWDVLAVAALFVMTVLAFSVDGIDGVYYQGGLAVFALASCAVIWAVTGGPPGHVARLFSLRPLQWLGRISYGVYLWHWPVIVYMTIPRIGLDRWAVDSLRIATTLAVAAASYRWLEQPIRRGALTGRRLWAVSGAALAVTLGLLVVATEGEPKVEAVEIDEDQPLPGIDNAVIHVPEADDVPDEAVKLLLVGDSGVAAWGPTLVETAEDVDDGTVAVAFSAQIQCSVLHTHGLDRQPDGEVIEHPRCDGTREDMWERLVDEYDPDVVVYYLANAGFVGEHRVDGEWLTECQPAYDTYLGDKLAGDADLLTADGAAIVFATSPYTAAMVEGTKAAVDCRNATYHRVAGERPGTPAPVIDLNAFIASQIPLTEESMFEDPVHLSEEGAGRASGWLLPLVDAAYGCGSVDPRPADCAPQGE